MRAVTAAAPSDAESQTSKHLRFIQVEDLRPFAVAASSRGFRRRRRGRLRSDGLRLEPRVDVALAKEEIATDPDVRNVALPHESVDSVSAPSPAPRELQDRE